MNLWLNNLDKTHNHSLGFLKEIFFLTIQVTRTVENHQDPSFRATR